VNRRLLLVACVPVALVAAVRVSFLVLAVWDLNPFWLWTPLNLSEAAALRDRGEVARLLQEGHDPNAVYLVRRDFIRDYSMRLTPVEAAQATQRDEIVDLLVDSGATPPADHTTRSH
jgi:hypothetical protein